MRKVAGIRFKKPGKISVIYQITEPNQDIFFSRKIEINKLTCYIHSFENIKEGNSPGESKPQEGDSINVNGKKQNIKAD